MRKPTPPKPESRRKRHSSPRLRVKRARLRLERLETRECTAVDYWVGAGDFTDPTNWLDGSVPELGVDDVVFDPELSQGSCDYYGPGGPPPVGGPIGGMGRSLTMMAGYTGTVTVYTAIDLERFEQHGGSFEQYAEDAHVWADEWIWSAGDLNANSPFLADINVKPGGTATVTGDDDREQGSNLKVWANSNVTINLTDAVITFEKNAGIEILAGGRLEHNRGHFNQGTGSTGQIVNSGKYYKLTQDLIICGLGITNAAATAEFRMGGRLILGAATQTGVSLLQQHGFMEFAPGAILTAGGGLKMTGGSLYTIGSTAPTIQGNVTVSGGQIVLSHDDLTKVGLLTITGHFLMDGGEYQVKIDPFSLMNDRIHARSIGLGGAPGGSAKLTTVTINLEAGSQVPNDLDFDILVATDGFISGNFDEFSLSRGDGTARVYIDMIVANNKKYRLSTVLPI